MSILRRETYISRRKIYISRRKTYISRRKIKFSRFPGKLPDSDKINLPRLFYLNHHIDIISVRKKVPKGTFPFGAVFVILRSGTEYSSK